MSENESEPVECVLVPMPLYDTVMGMLVHLWGIVQEPAVKQLIHETIERLRRVSEADDR